VRVQLSSSAYSWHVHMHGAIRRWPVGSYTGQATASHCSFRFQCTVVWQGHGRRVSGGCKMSTDPSASASESWQLIDSTGWTEHYQWAFLVHMHSGGRAAFITTLWAHWQTDTTASLLTHVVLTHVPRMRHADCVLACDRHASVAGHSLTLMGRHGCGREGCKAGWMAGIRIVLVDNVFPHTAVSGTCPPSPRPGCKGCRRSSCWAAGCHRRWHCCWLCVW
jgi:hypothetical protein